MRASPQRPAIRWDLTPRSAPNRSLIRFSSFNETCDRRLIDQLPCRTFNRGHRHVRFGVTKRPNRERRASWQRRSTSPTSLLHRRKLRQHLFRRREIGRILVRKSTRGSHLFEHRKLLGGRALKVAHQRRRDALALRLFLLPQHQDHPPHSNPFHLTLDPSTDRVVSMASHYRVAE